MVGAQGQAMNLSGYVEFEKDKGALIYNCALLKYVI